MANEKSSKGNPASHRMTNANLKAKRSRLWAAQERAKDRRRRDNAARAAINVQLRQAGIPVPWNGRAIKRHPLLGAQAAAIISGAR